MVRQFTVTCTAPVPIQFMYYYNNFFFFFNCIIRFEKFDPAAKKGLLTRIKMKIQSLLKRAKIEEASQKEDQEGKDVTKTPDVGADGEASRSNHGSSSGEHEKL